MPFSNLAELSDLKFKALDVLLTLSLSKMVNKTYNLGFPEVLNIMRVDYAGEYIRSHPAATQEEIAKACGFVSASSFNSTFKRITGFTPKVWAARNASAVEP